MVIPSGPGLAVVLPVRLIVMLLATLDARIRNSPSASLRPLFSPELKARTIEGLIRILTKIKGALVEVSET